MICGHIICPLITCPHTETLDRHAQAPPPTLRRAQRKPRLPPLAGGQPLAAASARRARADAMMTSQVLRALERRKLVRRVPHPSDTRARVLRPTAAGRKLARQAAYLVDDADRAFFEAVGADRARLAEALGALAGAGEEPV